MTQILLGIAQAGQAAPAGQGGGSPLMSFVPMLLIIGVMYLLVLRPQMRKQKEVQRMLSELKKGDEVVTSGGVLGRIAGMKDDVVTLQVQEGVRIQVLRSAISGRQKTAAATEPTKGEAKAETKAT